MNYDHDSATIGTRAVDPRMLADDKFLKRMGNFERVCKQIDAKHDHVMEMLANIQEQLRTLEMKQRKGRDAQIQSQMAAIKPPYLSVSRPQQIEVESRILPPNQRLSSSSYASNDAKLENEGCVEVLKHAPIISAVVEETVETDFFTTRAAKIHARKVFDEIPESKKSKISVIPPLVRGSEIAEVYGFGVSNLQFQTPLVSTQEIKMESDGLSLISNSNSFSSNSDGTKQEDEGSLKVSIYTTVAKLQPQESESGFEVFPKPTLVASKSIDSIGKVEALSWPLIVPKAVEEISVLENPKMMDNHSIHYVLCRDVHSRDLVQWPKNAPNLNICELTPSWRIMASPLLHFPFLYNYYNGDGLTKEELKWLDTGQYLIVSGLSREGVTSNFIVSWKWMNAMYWDRNRLVAEMQLKGLKLDLLTIEVGKHLVELGPLAWVSNNGLKSFVIKSDIITYSTLLLVLSDAGKMSEAKSILKEILDEYIAPMDISTSTKLRLGHCRLGELDVVVSVLMVIIKLSITTEAGEYRTLVGKFDRVVNLLVKRIEKAIVMRPQDTLHMEHSSYNPIIDYLGSNGQAKVETRVRQSTKLGGSFHHDRRLAEQNKKRAVVVLQSGFGNEYDSINLGDSVSYPTAGSGGNSNKDPCAEKSIEKPRSSGCWFMEDGLLNLDENEELVTNFEFKLFELEVVDVLVYVVANGHQADSALFGENGAVAALPSGATIGDKHYVADVVFLVPSVETKFARDASSCYRFSDLRNRVEEKAGGRITTSNMESIYIQFIRKGGLRAVCEHVSNLKKKSTGIVDVVIFVAELIPTELTGKRFLCRSGASIFSPRVGINPKAPVLSCAMILFMERIGEAHEGWEFDQSLTSSLRWITLETGHVIPTLLADKESILVPMCERPSAKPPFQFRHLSLGDKTLSRGEYCHGNGWFCIRRRVLI